MTNLIRKTILAAFALFASLTVIAQRSLPQAAKSYLQQHFAKGKVSRVERDDHKYEVHLSGGYELEFSSTGKILEVEGNGNMIPESIIPARVKAYLKQKYAGRKVRKIEMEPNGYEVSLGGDLEVKFDKSGNFRKTDD